MQIETPKRFDFRLEVPLNARPRAGLRPRAGSHRQAVMKLSFLSGRQPDAEQAGERLRARYGHHHPDKADAIVAVGGDGFMLEVLRDQFRTNIPVYGLNQGTVGFLMNRYAEEDLIERIETAETAIIHPLTMAAHCKDGRVVHELAINEISLYRQTRQSARLRLSVNGKTRMETLICDGALLATPAGSTAYNLSAHGPILPLTAELLTLTPISAFRPRRWKGALLPHDAQVDFEVIDPIHRPVSAVADNVEVRDVVRVEARADQSLTLNLLFDQGQSLDERILREQFEY